MKTFLFSCVAILAMQEAALFAQTQGKDHQIDELIVTGTNRATSRRLLPYSVSVVDSPQLQSSGKTQLLSALSAEVPSLFITERNLFGFGVSNGGSGGISIRGVGGSQGKVLMMVDGQPQYAGIYSHHIADFYDTENVDHVEILRGPASVLYGSNAMGGVINVITRHPQAEGWHTSISSQYGSYNTWQNQLTGTFRQGRFSSLVSLGYDMTDGTQENFDFRQKNLYAKIGYQFNQHWNLGADYSLMNFIGNDPIYPRLSNPESNDIYHQNVTRGESSVTLNNSYNKTNGSLRTYYSYGNHFIDDPRHFHSVDDRFGILLYQTLQTWKGASATLGFDFDHYTGKIPVSGGRPHTEGSVQTMTRKSVTEYSPYLTLTQNLLSDVLTIDAGVRMAMSNRFGTHWVPQAGITLHPATDWTLRASLAKGYRNPSFRELYLYRPANPDLEPERMMNYEVGISHRFSRLFNANLTAYFSEGSNLIQTLNMKNVNTGRFINKGIELSLASHPTDRVSLRAAYSYLHTSVSNLTAAPKNMFSIGIQWQPLPQFTVDTDVKSIHGLYVWTDRTHEHYTVWNMKLTWATTSWFNVFATLSNITATHYQINHGYDMPRFTAMGGIRIRL